MFTHATISMSNSSNTPSTTSNSYTPHSLNTSKDIRNVTSADRLAKVRTQCKLKEVVSDQLRLPKHDIQLISDFYCALTWEDRMKVLVKIMDDDSFIERQADLFYRYVDGRDWLQVDLDRLMVGFYTSYRKAEEIYFGASDDDFPEDWNVEYDEYSKYYKHMIIVEVPGGFVFRLELCSKGSSPDYRHLKLDFTPSYFTDDELKTFFSWLHSVIGEEYEQALEQSLISQMEVGLQLHHIFSPLIAIAELGERKEFKWKIHGLEQEFIQATYFKTELEDGSSLTTKNYCPVTKFINGLNEDRFYTQEQARQMLSRICHATRLESVYEFKRVKNAVEYSILELEKVPFSLPEAELIAPEHFRQLNTVDRTLLASTKSSQNTTPAIKLPAEKLQQSRCREIQKLIENLNKVD